MRIFVDHLINIKKFLTHTNRSNIQNLYQMLGTDTNKSEYAIAIALDQASKVSCSARN